MLYLFCYDVVCTKRRTNLANVLLDFGVRVQESVFECDLTSESRLRHLLRCAAPFVDEATDTLRVYKTCADCTKSRQIIGINRGDALVVPSTLIL